MIAYKIDNIMKRYYTGQITREQEEEELRNCVNVQNFNIAICSLEKIASLDITRSVILVGFILDLYNSANEKPMRDLLLLNFHDSHEDIVRLFQLRWNNNIENITILIQATRSIPDYLSPVDIKHSYLQNIIYAIGAQPQPESLCALEYLLSETKDKEIKKMISSQIEKRRSIVGGKYEFEKIAKWFDHPAYLPKGMGLKAQVRPQSEATRHHSHRGEVVATYSGQWGDQYWSTRGPL